MKVYTEINGGGGTGLLSCREGAEHGYKELEEGWGKITGKQEDWSRRRLESWLGGRGTCQAWDVVKDQTGLA